MVGEADHDPFAQGPGRRILDRPASGLVDDAEDGVQRLTRGLPLRPAGQLFGDTVEVVDAPVGVGADDGVADAPERHLQHLALLVRSSLRRPERLAEADDERAGEEVGGQPDQILGGGETDCASGRDEQVVAGEVAGDGDQDGRQEAAQPDRGGDGAEDGDQRQRAAHHRNEQLAQEHGGRQSGER